MECHKIPEHGQVDLILNSRDVRYVTVSDDANITCVDLEGSLCISNARGIQIGNNNNLSIHSYDPTQCSSFLPGNIWTSSQLREGIQKYGKSCHFILVLFPFIYMQTGFILGP